MTLRRYCCLLFLFASGISASAETVVAPRSVLGLSPRDLSICGAGTKYVTLGPQHTNEDVIAACTRLLNHTIQNTGEKVAFLTNRALAYGAKGQYELALADCTEAVDLRQRLEMPYMCRAIVQSQAGRFDAAIADYSKIIELRPSAAEALGGRAASYLSRGDYQHAIEDSTRALALAPNSISLYLARAIAYRHLGQAQQAAADFEQLTKPVARDAGQLTLRCLSQAVEGTHLDLALKDCSQAHELRPADANALSSGGFVNLRMGRAADAVTQYSAALALKPSDAFSLFGRGIAKARLGDASGAAADMAAAMRINPYLKTMYADLGIDAPAGLGEIHPT